MTKNNKSEHAAEIKAAFLDRDGVINRDKGYVFRISDFEFMPDAIEGMLELQRLGYELVVITNQSGIGRGYFTDAEYHLFTAHMVKQLAAKGVEIAGIYFCPHHPREFGENFVTCDCRKPAPGLIFNAAQDLNISLDHSIMVGDKLSDIEAGHAAHVGRCYLISSANRVEPPEAIGCVQLPSLLSVAKHVAITDRQRTHS